MPLNLSARSRDYRFLFQWEGWWSYELCFDKYIRQFHQEKDGTTTAEFFLGRLSDPLDSVSTDQYHVVTYNKVRPLPPSTREHV